MEKIKSIVVVMALSLMVAGGLQAQERKTVSPEKKAAMAEKIEANMESLSLSAEQKASYISIHKKYAEQLREVKTDTDKVNRKTRAKAFKNEKDAEIKAILQPDQYEKYQALQSERKNKFKAMRKAKKQE